jgi:hypothetical protein
MKLIEDIMLEIRGAHGVLRLGMTREELEKTLRRRR